MNGDRYRNTAIGTKRGRSRLPLNEEVVPLALEYEVKLFVGLAPDNIAKLERQLQQLEQTAGALRKE